MPLSELTQRGRASATGGKVSSPLLLALDVRPEAAPSIEQAPANEILCSLQVGRSALVSELIDE
jgi:hypothetical protein